jgi:CDP-paratose 2-epimerase
MEIRSPGIDQEFALLRKRPDRFQRPRRTVRKAQKTGLAGLRLIRVRSVNVLVTGSSGLIGSEAVLHLDREGHSVWGVDNNMRREFFGPPGDTRWNLERLRKVARRFNHEELDIRDRQGILDLFRKLRFDLIIHCAAQPSHDKAKEIPFVDFDVNAVGTLNLLEATRLHQPEAVFILMSTN